LISCKAPSLVTSTTALKIPEFYTNKSDSTSIGSIQWRTFFTDKHLQNLIDIALINNQELQITMQEIEIAKNEARVRKGFLLPSIGLRAGSGVEKVGKYTSQGAGDASTEIYPGKEMPDPLTDFSIGAYANWEVDIWSKLHTAKKSAVTRYLATVEGKNFVMTNLIAEIAKSYYELQALDSQLLIVKQNIALQKGALEIVKLQKEAARGTELGVQKFQAEVLKSQSLEFDINQNIKETENNINSLLGRFPQKITRNQISNLTVNPLFVSTGLPSELLENRPDIKQSELELAAAKLDVKVARAEFFPSFGISAGVGYNAFKTSFLFKSPASLLYSLVGEIAAPLINKNAIKAEFNMANARQIQAMYNYERVIVNAYIEVSNQLSKIDNLDKSYELKARQVAALDKSIDVSNDLFKSARVDYLEVLLTQRDALESKLELIETRKNQLSAVVSIYKDLGGGWR
jgi:NodT family efflux transporter outer membrane factor (OMF) lipoprotein